MDCSTVDFPVFHYLPEFAQTHVHWVEDAIPQPHLLSSPSPPALNLSQHQDLFLWVSSSHQVVKVLFLQLQHSVFPMNIQGWFPLRWTGWISLQSKGLFKSLLQPYSSKASVLRRSAIFMVRLSHPYITTGKNIALTRQTFVGKGMSWLFNTLSSFIIAFHPRNKRLWISWLQSAFRVILRLKKITSVTISFLPYLFTMKWWDRMSWSSFFECWVLS